MTELTKVCTKCGEEKVLSEFHTRKDSKDGFRDQCRRCFSLRKKEYHKAYYENNKQSKKEYMSEYYKNNKEAMKEYSKVYNEKNKESIKARQNEYIENNKESIKEYKSEYNKIRRKTDIGFRIKCNIRIQLNRVYKLYSTKWRQVSSSSIFTQEAMDHLLLTKPTDDLKYHIDHIIPISAFDVDDVEHLKLAHVKENLRWLEASANMSKKDLIDWDLIESCPKLTEIAKIIGLKKNT